ncbi:hypothetical protein [Pseudotenacibaculum haliotis]|uniref:Transmembrane protein n=1 Tax=Pseudotenacibaculum haliotis TaxID=1862138 RepID=A0ABW5LPR2_9FLAO
MTKNIVIFFFSFILMASIVVPTYVTLMDGKCEIAEVVDFGDEEENKKGKEAAKDLELKLFYENDSSQLFVGLEKKKRISFYSKNYVSYQKKLLSPPPEVIS